MLFITLTFLTMDVCWQLIFSVFVFLKKSAFHLHFWKIHSLTIEFCDIRLFFVFKTLKVSRHCFLACRVLDGKCIEILIFVPMHETHFFFSSGYPQTVFVFNFQQFVYDMPGYVFCCCYYFPLSVWCSLSFIDL